MQNKNLNDQWQLTYASLMTVVLALFILVIIVSGKSQSKDQNLENELNSTLLNLIMLEKNKHQLNWLKVTNTATKGIKLLIPSNFEKNTMFPSGKANVNSSFSHLFSALSQILMKMDLDQLRKKFPFIDIKIRIEGHSDRTPVGRRSNYKNNWDLSTARAANVMELLRQESHLDPRFFSISGYSNFHPLKNINSLAENRRIEIYLVVKKVNQQWITYDL